MIIGPNIVTDGLVFGYGADDRNRFYKGEPTTNLYSGPSSPALYFTGAYNGNYGFGSNTNIQTNIDNSDQIIANLNVQKISRINSDVSQFDYIEWTGIISRGFTTTFQPNEVRTISFYYKGTFGTILNPYIGNSGTLLLYSDNAISGNNTTDIRIPVTTNEWQRVSFRVYNYSSISTSVFGYSWMVLHQNQFTSILSNTEYWKFTGIQVELKSHPTQFVTGTRGATESLIDLKKTTTIDVSNVSFDSTATPVFDGTGDYIDLGSHLNNLGSTATFECIFKSINTTNLYKVLLGWGYGTTMYGGISIGDYTGAYSDESLSFTINGGFGDQMIFHVREGVTKYADNDYHHVIITSGQNSYKVYIDGIEKTITFQNGSQASTYTQIIGYDEMVNSYIGKRPYTGSEGYFNGYIPIVKIYNKILTLSEIQQNLNAYKKRFFRIGDIASYPARSASEIKSIYPDSTDGVYWIDLPTVGPTQIYCLMDNKYNGGGWMMMMKSTTGTTFNYDSNYWTTNNTLNPTDLSRNNADAKYNTMNYYNAKDIMAIWPDILTDGGSISGLGVWSWLQNNFYDGAYITPTTFFSTVNGKYVSDAKTFSGWQSGIFSSQSGYRWYGFNYSATSWAKVRWGFGWNNEADPNSNDVSGGIGLMPSFDSYSAGDHINCCTDTTGINRSARVEIYIR